MHANLSAWLNSDNRNSYSVFALSSGGYGAARVHTPATGRTAERVGAVRTGKTILEAERRLDVDVAFELAEPTVPNNEIPDPPAPATRPTGVDNWSTPETLPEKVKTLLTSCENADSARLRAARLLEEGARV